MLSKKNRKETILDRNTTNRNVIGKGTKFTGELISEGDFRIDGEFEGILNTKGRVIIGKGGFINGTVECTNADVEGKFSGEFNVSDTLTAKASCYITGTVIVGQLATEPGASFNATCNMKGAVKELAKGNSDGQKGKQKSA